jgi:hypothetical protein
VCDLCGLRLWTIGTGGDGARLTRKGNPSPRNGSRPARRSDYRLLLPRGGKGVPCEVAEAPAGAEPVQVPERGSWPPRRGHMARGIAAAAGVDGIDAAAGETAPQPGRWLQLLLLSQKQQLLL